MAGEIYQSSRGGQFDLPRAFLPEKAKRIGEIGSFDAFADYEDRAQLEIAEKQAIPSTVTLKDETILQDIHRVLVCTRYHVCDPFLPEFHDASAPADNVDDQVLVTDGTRTHNLHKDMFYIPDTTLSLVGIPYYSVTFTLFEVQAMTIAAVYSERARLPTKGGYAARLSSTAGDERLWEVISFSPR